MFSPGYRRRKLGLSRVGASCGRGPAEPRGWSRGRARGPSTPSGNTRLGRETAKLSLRVLGTAVFIKATTGKAEQPRGWECETKRSEVAKLLGVAGEMKSGQA